MNDGSTPESRNDHTEEEMCLGQYKHKWSWIWDGKGEMTNQQRCINCDKVRTVLEDKDKDRSNEQ